MPIKPYSDSELAELRALPKMVTNPGARWVDKPGHRQRNFQVVAGDDAEVAFAIYQRQSSRDDSDFSCGIALLTPGATRLTLARYNGPSHIHGQIEFLPHIHRASARAIASGKKPESEANETDRFTTLDGAFRCLLEDFHIGGIASPEPDQGKLL